MLLALISIMTAYVAYRCYCYFLPSSTIDPNGKYVLVSGCDTGIGHSLAIQLDQQGFNVFAGVLMAHNVPLLKKKLSTRATVFVLDVTKQTDIDAAFGLVRAATSCLHALVNNAGILTHGCIDWMTLETMQRIMDVNFFGHVAVTKRFLPLLTTATSNSRVVNVVSAAGFFTFPHTSAYSASKYALKSFSDCLRREMSPWKLHVSTVEPGALRTPMLEAYESTLRYVWNQLPGEIQQRWGIDYLNSMITTAVTSRFMINADNPERVVGAIRHAVMSIKPKICYRPGWQSKIIFYILYLSPAWLSDKFMAMAISFVPDGVRNRPRE